MYFNDVHIAYYAIAAILGLIVGEVVAWANKRLPEYKSVISKEFFTEHKMNFKPNYLLMFIMAIIYVTLLYVIGIKDTLIANLDLIKYMILAPMLVSAFCIDYKLQIIPNRLNLTIFEIGLIFTFIYGLSDVAITINMLLGMVTVGLFFGFSNIIVITLMSFLIGAILSIILLIAKRKKTSEYIPFGPFIVIATYICMYIPFEQIVRVLMTIFTLGMYQG